MVSLKNNLVVAGAVCFLLAACTVTSTTTNSGDGGSSSGSSGSSSGSSGSSSGTSGSSGSSSGSSGSSSGTSGSSGGGGTCKPVAIKLNNAACDTCAHTNCQTQIDACFKDTSTTGCECQTLDDCIQGCLGGDGGIAAEKQCVNDCANSHSQPSQALWLGWDQCVAQKCGADGGTGDCQ